MTHHSRAPMLLCASVAALLLAACGVSSENEPQPITDTVSPDTGPTPSVDSSPDTASPTTTTGTTSSTVTSSVTSGPAPTPSPRPPLPGRRSPPHSTGPSPTVR